MQAPIKRLKKESQLYVVASLLTPYLEDLLALVERAPPNFAISCGDFFDALAAIIDAKAAAEGEGRGTTAAEDDHGKAPEEAEGRWARLKRLFFGTPPSSRSALQEDADTARDPASDGGCEEAAALARVRAHLDDQLRHGPANTAAPPHSPSHHHHHGHTNGHAVATPPSQQLHGGHHPHLRDFLIGDKKTTPTAATVHEAEKKRKAKEKKNKKEAIDTSAASLCSSSSSSAASSAGLWAAEDSPAWAHVGLSRAEQSTLWRAMVFLIRSEADLLRRGHIEEAALWLERRGVATTEGGGSLLRGGSSASGAGGGGSARIFRFGGASSFTVVRSGGGSSRGGDRGGAFTAFDSSFRGASAAGARSFRMNQHLLHHSDSEATSATDEGSENWSGGGGSNGGGSDSAARRRRRKGARKTPSADMGKKKTQSAAAADGTNDKPKKRTTSNSKMKKSSTSLSAPPIAPAEAEPATMSVATVSHHHQQHPQQQPYDAEAAFFDSPSANDATPTSLMSPHITCNNNTCSNNTCNNSNNNNNHANSSTTVVGTGSSAFIVGGALPSSAAALPQWIGEEVGPSPLPNGEAHHGAKAAVEADPKLKSGKTDSEEGVAKSAKAGGPIQNKMKKLTPLLMKKKKKKRKALPPIRAKVLVAFLELCRERDTYFRSRGEALVTTEPQRLLITTLLEQEALSAAKGYSIKGMLAGGNAGSAGGAGGEEKAGSGGGDASAKREKEEMAHHTHHHHRNHAADGEGAAVADAAGPNGATQGAAEAGKEEGHHHHHHHHGHAHHSHHHHHRGAENANAVVINRADFLVRYLHATNSQRVEAMRRLAARRFDVALWLFAGRGCSTVGSVAARLFGLIRLARDGGGAAAGGNRSHRLKRGGDNKDAFGRMTSVVSLGDGQQHHGKEASGQRGASPVGSDDPALDGSLRHARLSKQRRKGIAAAAEGGEPPALFIAEPLHQGYQQQQQQQVTAAVAADGADAHNAHHVAFAPLVETIEPLIAGSSEGERSLGSSVSSASLLGRHGGHGGGIEDDDEGDTSDNDDDDDGDGEAAIHRSHHRQRQDRIRRGYDRLHTEAEQRGGRIGHHADSNAGSVHGSAGVGGGAPASLNGSVGSASAASVRTGGGGGPQWQRLLGQALELTSTEIDLICDVLIAAERNPSSSSTSSRDGSDGGEENDATKPKVYRTQFYTVTRAEYGRALSLAAVRSVLGSAVATSSSSSAAGGGGVRAAATSAALPVCARVMLAYREQILDFLFGREAGGGGVGSDGADAYRRLEADDEWWSDGDTDASYTSTSSSDAAVPLRSTSPAAPLSSLPIGSDDTGNQPPTAAVAPRGVSFNTNGLKRKSSRKRGGTRKGTIRQRTSLFPFSPPPAEKEKEFYLPDVSKRMELMMAMQHHQSAAQDGGGASGGIGGGESDFLSISFNSSDANGIRRNGTASASGASSSFFGTATSASSASPTPALMLSTSEAGEGEGQQDEGKGVKESKEEEAFVLDYSNVDMEGARFDEECLSLLRRLLVYAVSGCGDALTAAAKAAAARHRGRVHSRALLASGAASRAREVLRAARAESSAVGGGSVRLGRRSPLLASSPLPTTGQQQRGILKAVSGGRQHHHQPHEAATAAAPLPTAAAVDDRPSTVPLLNNDAASPLPPPSAAVTVAAADPMAMSGSRKGQGGPALSESQNRSRQLRQSASVEDALLDASRDRDRAEKERLRRRRRAPYYATQFIDAIAANARATKDILDPLEVTLFLFPQEEMSVGVVKALVGMTGTPPLTTHFALDYCATRSKRETDIHSLVLFIPLVIFFIIFLMSGRGLAADSYIAYGMAVGYQQAALNIPYPTCVLEARPAGGPAPPAGSTATRIVTCSATETTTLSEIVRPANIVSVLAGFIPTVLWPSADPTADASGTKVSETMSPVGAVRIRQHRVKEYVEGDVTDRTTQTLHDYVAVARDIRYPPFKKRREEKRAIHTAAASNPLIQSVTGPLYDGSRFSSCGELNGTVRCLGQSVWFDCDGYAAQIPFRASREEYETVVSELLGSDWIDRQTRAVIVEYLLFHEISGMLVLVKHLFEIPAGGQLRHSSLGRPFFLNVRDVHLSAGVLVCYIIFVVIFAYYTIQHGLTYAYAIAELFGWGSAGAADAAAEDSSEVGATYANLKADGGGSKTNNKKGDAENTKKGSEEPAMLSKAGLKRVVRRVYHRLTYAYLLETLLGAFTVLLAVTNIALFAYLAIMYRGVSWHREAKDAVWQLEYYPAHMEAQYGEYEDYTIIAVTNIIISLVLLLRLTKYIPGFESVVGGIEIAIFPLIQIFTYILFFLFGFGFLGSVVWGHYIYAHRSIIQSTNAFKDALWLAIDLGPLQNSDQVAFGHMFVIFFDWVILVFFYAAMGATLASAFGLFVSAQYDATTLRAVVATDPHRTLQRHMPLTAAHRLLGYFLLPVLPSRWRIWPFYAYDDYSYHNYYQCLDRDLSLLVRLQRPSQVLSGSRARRRGAERLAGAVRVLALIRAVSVPNVSDPSYKYPYAPLGGGRAAAAIIVGTPEEEGDGRGHRRHHRHHHRRVSSSAAAKKPLTTNGGKKGAAAEGLEGNGVVGQHHHHHHNSDLKKAARAADGGDDDDDEEDEGRDGSAEATSAADLIEGDFGDDDFDNDNDEDEEDDGEHDGDGDDDSSPSSSDGARSAGTGSCIASDSCTTASLSSNDAEERGDAMLLAASGRSANGSSIFFPTASVGGTSMLSRSRRSDRHASAASFAGSGGGSGDAAAVGAGVPFPSAVAVGIPLSVASGAIPASVAADHSVVVVGRGREGAGTSLIGGYPGDAGTRLEGGIVRRGGGGGSAANIGANGFGAGQQETALPSVYDYIESDVFRSHVDYLLAMSLFVHVPQDRFRVAGLSMLEDAAGAYHTWAGGIAARTVCPAEADIAALEAMAAAVTAEGTVPPRRVVIPSRHHYSQLVPAGAPLEEAEVGPSGATANSAVGSSTLGPSDRQPTGATTAAQALAPAAEALPPPLHFDSIVSLNGQGQGVPSASPSTEASVTCPVSTVAPPQQQTATAAQPLPHTTPPSAGDPRTAAEGSGGDGGGEENGEVEEEEEPFDVMYERVRFAVEAIIPNEYLHRRLFLAVLGCADADRYFFTNPAATATGVDVAEKGGSSAATTRSVGNSTTPPAPSGAAAALPSAAVPLPQPLPTVTMEGFAINNNSFALPAPPPLAALEAHESHPKQQRCHQQQQRRRVPFSEALFYRIAVENKLLPHDFNFRAFFFQSGVSTALSAFASSAVAAAATDGGLMSVPAEAFLPAVQSEFRVQCLGHSFYNAEMVAFDREAFRVARLLAMADAEAMLNEQEEDANDEDEGAGHLQHDHHDHHHHHHNDGGARVPEERVSSGRGAKKKDNAKGKNAEKQPPEAKEDPASNKTKKQKKTANARLPRPSEVMPRQFLSEEEFIDVYSTAIGGDSTTHKKLPTSVELSRLRAIFPSGRFDWQLFALSCQCDPFSAVYRSFEAHFAKSMVSHDEFFLWLFVHVPLMICVFFFAFFGYEGEYVNASLSLRGSFAPDDSPAWATGQIADWLRGVGELVWEESTIENISNPSPDLWLDPHVAATSGRYEDGFARLHQGANYYLRSMRVFQTRVKPIGSSECGRRWNAYFGDGYRHGPDPASGRRPLRWPEGWASASNTVRQWYEARVERDFSNTFTNDCLSGWDYGSHEAKAPFSPTGPISAEVADAFTHRKESVHRRPYTYDLTYAFQAYYPPRGYYTDIPFNIEPADAKGRIEELLTGGWIDDRTRLVMVKLVTYNANLKTFVSTRAGFEVTAGGAIMPFSRVLTFNDSLLSEAGVIILSVVLWLFIFGFFALRARLALHLRAVWKPHVRFPLLHGLRSVFFNFAWLYDLVVIALTIIVWVWRIYSRFHKPQDELGSDGMGTYPHHFEWLCSVNDIMRVLEGVSLFMYMARFIFVVTSALKLDIVQRAFVSVARSLLTIFVIFLTALVLFTFCVMLFWGYILYDARSFQAAFIHVLVGTTLGGSIQDGMAEYREIATPIFQSIFFLIVFVCLFQMWMSVMLGGLGDVAATQYDASLATAAAATYGRFERQASEEAALYRWSWGEWLFATDIVLEARHFGRSVGRWWRRLRRTVRRSTCCGRGNVKKKRTAADGSGSTAAAAGEKSSREPFAAIGENGGVGQQRVSSNLREQQSGFILRTSGRGGGGGGVPDDEAQHFALSLQQSNCEPFASSANNNKDNNDPFKSDGFGSDDDDAEPPLSTIEAHCYSQRTFWQSMHAWWFAVDAGAPRDVAAAAGRIFTVQALVFADMYGGGANAAAAARADRRRYLRIGGGDEPAATNEPIAFPTENVRSGKEGTAAASPQQHQHEPAQPLPAGAAAVNIPSSPCDFPSRVMAANNNSDENTATISAAAATAPPAAAASVATVAMPAGLARGGGGGATALPPFPPAPTITTIADVAFVVPSPIVEVPITPSPEEGMGGGTAAAQNCAGSSSIALGASAAAAQQPAGASTAPLAASVSPDTLPSSACALEGRRREEGGGVEPPSQPQAGAKGPQPPAATQMKATDSAAPKRRASKPAPAAGEAPHLTLHTYGRFRRLPIWNEYLFTQFRGAYVNIRDNLIDLPAALFGADGERLWLRALEDKHYYELDRQMYAQANPWAGGVASDEDGDEADEHHATEAASDAE